MYRFSSPRLSPYRQREHFRLELGRADDYLAISGDTLQPVALIALGKLLTGREILAAARRALHIAPTEHDATLLPEEDRWQYDSASYDSPRHVPGCNIETPSGLIIRDCNDFPTHRLAILGAQSSRYQGRRGRWGRLYGDIGTPAVAVAAIIHDPERYLREDAPTPPPAPQVLAMQFGEALTSELK